TRPHGASTLTAWGSRKVKRARSAVIGHGAGDQIAAADGSAWAHAAGEAKKTPNKASVAKAPEAATRSKNPWSCIFLSNSLLEVCFVFCTLSLLSRLVVGSAQMGGID